MTSKNCTVCKEIKPLSDFGKNSSYKDNLGNECVSCRNSRVSAYRKTKEGVATAIYGHQRGKSKLRKHPMPNYTKNEFSEWLFNQQRFHVLFELWVKSNYLPSHTPSCDRLDDYEPYTLDNLRLVTWFENDKKARSDRKNGINNKISKAVLKLDLNHKVIAEYYSAAQAERVTGVWNTSISNCCHGKSKTAGGFKWVFA